MVGRPGWYYTYVISFSFDNAGLQSQHPRVDYQTAWDEGALLVKKFAEKGMSVSLRVRDIRRESYDFTFEPFTKLDRGA